MVNMVLNLVVNMETQISINILRLLMDNNKIMEQDSLNLMDNIQIIINRNITKLVILIIK